MEHKHTTPEDTTRFIAAFRDLRSLDLGKIEAAREFDYFAHEERMRQTEALVSVLRDASRAGDPDIEQIYVVITLTEDYVKNINDGFEQLHDKYLHLLKVATTTRHVMGFFANIEKDLAAEMERRSDPPDTPPAEGS